MEQQRGMGLEGCRLRTSSNDFEARRRRTTIRKSLALGEGPTPAGSPVTLIALVLLALCSWAPSATASDVLVPAGSDWRYLDDGSVPAANWNTVGFNDGAWSLGAAQLGYGDGDEQTLLSFGPNPADKHITTYLRHEFLVADASPYVALSLDLLRDDGVVVYLNGVELMRNNLPAGLIDENTLALWEVNEPDESQFNGSDFDSSSLLSGTNVLAVELHQRSAAGPDLSLDLQLIAHQLPLVRRGPYLQLGTETSMRIRWRTFPPSDSGVWWGTTQGSLTNFLSDGTQLTDHDLELTGLTPGTTYHYAFGTSAAPIGGDDGQHFFVTAPSLGDASAARFWVLGDAGTLSPVQEAVRDAYESFTGSTHTDLWLMLGDNAYLLGLDGDYQNALFDIYPDFLRQSVLWPARGNWETNAGVFYDQFNFPTAAEAGGVASGTEAYFSFDHGQVHFICLDSIGSNADVGGPMWTWLQADLAATGQEWRIAYWHHPPYSKGAHDSDTDPKQTKMRENFGPLLEAGQVDLVLCGHSHSYERSFLLDGHQGVSGSLTPAMIVDDGNGREGLDGAYNQAAGPNAGTVYVVCGSSGGSNNISELHPAMHTALGLAGSLVIDVNGGRLDLRFLTDTGTIADEFTILSSSFEGAYCLSVDHEEGCSAEISASGVASATSASPFTLLGTNVSQNKPGLLFYGLGPARKPFFNGWRCVAPPFKRTPVQNSGGASACQGSYSYDFNARIQSGIDPALIPGTTVYSQYWFRDAGSSNTSDAYQFVIAP